MEALPCSYVIYTAPSTACVYCIYSLGFYAAPLKLSKMAVRWPSHLISFLPFLPSCHPWHPWTRPASPRQPWRPSWGASEHGRLSVTNMTSFSVRRMTSFIEVRVRNVISYIHKCGVIMYRPWISNGLSSNFPDFFFIFCSITLMKWMDIPTTPHLYPLYPFHRIPAALSSFTY